MRSFFAALRLALSFSLVSAAAATATTFTVTGLADSGPGSLRQAVLDANGTPGVDQVAFAAGLSGGITLTSGEILISDSLVVSGPGAGALTVSGNDHSRIFHVEKVGITTPIDVILSGLTLTRGNSELAGNMMVGGAVLNDGENLTILDSVISASKSGLFMDPPTLGCGGNVGFLGQGRGTLRIANSTLTGGSTDSFMDGGNLCALEGRLTLERSTISGGTAFEGGGLFLESLTEGSTIVLSTISGNRASSSGGGIFSSFLGTSLTIESSTISGNVAGNPAAPPSFSSFGGGLEIDQGQLQILNSTISGNAVNGGGGGISFPGRNGSSLLLRLTTVSNNTATFRGGSIWIQNLVSGITLDHAIVANGAPQDLEMGPGFAPTVTANYSLIEAPGAVLLVGAHNRTGVDPLLAPLANNGGLTLTHRPQSGSPAIDAGDPAIPSPPATDQRGSARIAGTSVDLGSVELQGGEAEIPTLSQWGILALLSLLSAAAVRRLRRGSMRSQFAALALSLSLASAGAATAATFTVTGLADSGPGSLRQAVLDANGAPGSDEIAFSSGLTGTITLTSGEIAITNSLIVRGPGARALTVSGNDHSRIFHVVNAGASAPIDVTLSGLTLTRGNSAFAPSTEVGGAVFSEGENLAILDCVISDSNAGFPHDPPAEACGGNVGFLGSEGGFLRIANSVLTGGSTQSIGGDSGGNLCVLGGSFTLEQSTLSGGVSTSGGGLDVEFLSGDSRIFQSTISGNQASSSGGGIASQYLKASLTIESSTISGNVAGSLSVPPSFGSFGGGLSVIQGNLSILNSTISGNAVNGGGGGIHFPGGGNSSLLLRLTTVSNNTATFRGGSMWVETLATGVELDHAILANGTPQDLDLGPGLAPTFTANYSLVEAPGAALFVGAHNRLGVDPLLGPLANNGGLTLTHRPQSGSPAIDAGNPAIPSPPATDQRGSARIAGASIDLGSVELQGGEAEIPTLSQWGILVLLSLLSAAAVRRLRQSGSAVREARPGREA